MLADALPPEDLRVEPSILGIARRRLPSGRVCRRDRSGEAEDPHRALADASLDHGACGCYLYQRIKRGLYAPPTSRIGNGGEDDVAHMGNNRSSCSPVCVQTKESIRD
jgi:hypothetical protein